MKAFILAIDPGTKESGVCLAHTEDYKPMWCSKIQNEDLFPEAISELLRMGVNRGDVQVVIERMQGNNMPVSSDVFLTCEWIGRFDVLFKSVMFNDSGYVFRREEYRALCSNIYGHNDKGVRNALVDRFAYGMPGFGKGTKKKPGWFYGFAADAWSAYAIAVTYIDREAVNG